MRKILAIAPLLFAVGILSGCGRLSERQSMVLGKWDVRQKFGGRDIAGKVEFRKDGTMTTEAMGKKIDSTYKFLDDNNIEIEMSMGPVKVKEKNKIESVTKQKMVLVDPHGGKAFFTRPR
jgi:uncharacterized protein (TIGR03066 family)